MKQLRLSHFLIQPILVWDDGNEIQAGPPLGASALAPSQMPDFIASWPAQFEDFKAPLEAEANADTAPSRQVKRANARKKGASTNGKKPVPQDA